VAVELIARGAGGIRNAMSHARKVRFIEEVVGFLTGWSTIRDMYLCEEIADGARFEG
jgi:hypothetical protein